MRTLYELIYQNAVPTQGNCVDITQLTSQQATQYKWLAVLQILEPHFQRVYKTIQTLILNSYHVNSETMLLPQEIYSEWVSVLTGYLSMQMSNSVMYANVDLLGNCSSECLSQLQTNIQEIAQYLASNATNAQAFSSVQTYITTCNWTNLEMIENVLLQLFIQINTPLSPNLFSPQWLFYQLESNSPASTAITEYIWILLKSQLINSADLDFVLEKIGVSNPLVELCWQAFWNPDFLLDEYTLSDTYTEMQKYIIQQVLDRILASILTLVNDLIIGMFNDLFNQQSYISSQNMNWFQMVIANQVTQYFYTKFQKINLADPLDLVIQKISSILSSISITFTIPIDTQTVYQFIQTPQAKNSLETILLQTGFFTNTITLTPLLDQFLQTLTTFVGTLDQFGSLLWIFYLMLNPPSTAKLSVPNAIQMVISKSTAFLESVTITFPQDTDALPALIANGTLNPYLQQIQLTLSTYGKTIIPNVFSQINQTINSLQDQVLQLVNQYIQNKQQLYNVLISKFESILDSSFQSFASTLVISFSSLMANLSQTINQYLQTNNISVSSSDLNIIIYDVAHNLFGTPVATTANLTLNQQVLIGQISSYLSSFSDQFSQLVASIVNVLKSSVNPSIFNTTEIQENLLNAHRQLYSTLLQARTPLATNPNLTNLINYRLAETNTLVQLQNTFIDSLQPIIQALNPIELSTQIFTEPTLSSQIRANIQQVNLQYASAMSNLTAAVTPNYTNLWGLNPVTTTNLLTTQTYHLMQAQSQVQTGVNNISNAVTLPIYDETNVVRTIQSISQQLFNYTDKTINAPNQIFTSINTALVGRSLAIAQTLTMIPKDLSQSLQMIQNNISLITPQNIVGLLINIINPVTGLTNSTANIYNQFQNLGNTFNQTLVTIQSLFGAQSSWASPQTQVPTTNTIDEQSLGQATPSFSDLLANAPQMAQNLITTPLNLVSNILPANPFVQSTNLSFNV